MRDKTKLKTKVPRTWYIVHHALVTVNNNICLKFGNEILQLKFPSGPLTLDGIAGKLPEKVADGSERR